MRLIVMFDLPTVEKEDKKNYQKFRNFLLNDGYDMLQWSIYSRLVNGFDQMETHKSRLVANLPPTGSIRLLEVTENQYTKMSVLVGTKKVSELRNDGDQLSFF